MKFQKQKLKKVKNEEGITLVALVVTIVILLILAGITITVMFGDNGILKKAQDAAEKSKIAEAKTKVDLAMADWQIVKHTESKTFESHLKETFGDANVTANGSSFNVKVDGYEFTVKDDGTVSGGNKEEVPTGTETLLAMYNQAVNDGCDNADGSCTNAKHLHIGDYVNYVEPTSGEYPITSARSGMSYEQKYTLSSTVNNLNWRVLGIDKETGGIKLIADSPMRLDENATKTDGYLYLRGAESYEYGPTEMNNACEMYSDGNYAVKARSVNMEDIDEKTGMTTNELREPVNLLTYMNHFEPLGSTYSFEGHYTPTKWIEIGKTADSSKAITVSGTTNGYKYGIAKTEEEKTALEAEGAKPVLLANTRIYDMLFKDTDYGTKKAYWLASRGVVAYSDMAGFGPGNVGTGGGMAMADSSVGYFSSRGYDEGWDGFSVRPVVILKSTVSAGQVQKIEDQPDSWSGGTTPSTGEPGYYN